MRRIDQLRGRRQAYGKPAPRLETLGLIVILLLILAIVVGRSWHYVHWSAR